MRPDALGIVGLGAVGGSIALDAARAGVPRVLGFATPPADGIAALKAGAITELATDARRLIRAADLVVLAAPPAAALRLLVDCAADLAARAVWCTDTSSVKAPIARLAARLGLDKFAGSHPYAGTHRAGFGAARAGLFERAIVYVCPAAGASKTSEEIAHFWESVCHAAPVVIEAEQHDQLLAWTSHLPQAAASALAGALSQFVPPGVSVGSGARDTTRLAGSTVEMWRDVLLLNREAVLRALDGFDDVIGGLRHALQTGDQAALTAFLQRGADWRRGLGE